MKLARLKKIRVSEPRNDDLARARFRGTEAQDAPLSTHRPPWRHHPRVFAIATGTLLLLLLGLAFKGWLGTAQMISRERLRLATVTRGHFVRDAAAEGTVVAAVSPTLFAIAPGTVSYAVRAGDAVKKGQRLAMLDSPELTNELQREQATLESLDAALARQQIEIRRQILGSQQRADLAQVAINAAERELKRSQWAWDQRVISERDYSRALDEVSTAKLNFDHARDSAALERDSRRSSCAPVVSSASARRSSSPRSSSASRTRRALAGRRHGGESRAADSARGSPPMRRSSRWWISRRSRSSSRWPRSTRAKSTRHARGDHVEGRRARGWSRRSPLRCARTRSPGASNSVGPQPAGCARTSAPRFASCSMSAMACCKFERGSFIDDNTRASTWCAAPMRCACR